MNQSSVALPEVALPRDERTGGNAAQSVWIYDPWCFTPWYTAALAKALAAANVSLRLVCPRYHLEPHYFARGGLRNQPGFVDLAAGMGIRQPTLRQTLRSIEYLANTAWLAGILARRPPAILHLQACPLLARGIATDLLLLQWAQRQGVRVVHTVHNLLPHDSAGSAKTLRDRRLHARLYQSCDRLICHTNDAASQLIEEFGLQPDRIDVVPHGPLFAERRAGGKAGARARLGLDSTRLLFLWQGVLAPYKGTDLLLDAWSGLMQILPPSAPPPALLIAGQGAATEIRSLRAKVQRLALTSSVRLDLEYIPASDLPDYFLAADVLVYPYHEITTSGALMTGLHYAVPILASDLPAFRLVTIPGVNGLLVPPMHQASLTAALLRLATDASLLQTLRLGAQANDARQVQWPAIAERTIATYIRALASDLS